MELTQLVVDELARIFPDAIIYTENQSSGFKEPSFYVSRIPTTQIKPALFDVQERTYSYQIVYFASSDQPNADIEQVQDLLSDNFLTLSDQATVRNRDFKPDSNERTLDLQFDVLLRMYKVDDTPMQRRLNVNGGIKEDENN